MVLALRDGIHKCQVQFGISVTLSLHIYTSKACRTPVLWCDLNQETYLELFWKQETELSTANLSTMHIGHELQLLSQVISSSSHCYYLSIGDASL